MFQKKAVSVLLALTLSAPVSLDFSSPVFANVQDSVVSELVAYNTDLSRSEILDVATTAAKEQNLTVEEVLNAMLEESKNASVPDDSTLTDSSFLEDVSSEAVTPSGNSNRVNIASSSSSSGNYRGVKMKQSRNKGDIFHMPARTKKVEHNHVGLFYETTKIIHAPGGGKNSEKKLVKNMTVNATTWIGYVITDQKTRHKAADYASKNFNNKPYNKVAVANKKIDNDSYNCSQLVWAAYKKYGVDLDSNGGFAVYPNDIKKSELVNWYLPVE